MALRWWERGIVYQVYPRSFQDSGGDGVGDLAGAAARLPYLARLGVDAVWLSPFFPSPMADFGYDVADYCGVDAVFGTLADFDALVARARALGLRVILDLVPNHSSDRHPWFIESASSRDAAKRDWYLWRDPGPGGGPPNNWVGNFGGPAWTFHAGTGQYYYHSFLPQQPDLNWRNAEVQAAMAEVLRFWMRRGVDGFRVDVMWMMIKDAAFRDNPVNPAAAPGGSLHDTLVPVFTQDRPEVHQVVAGLRRVLDGFPDRVMIGELYLPIERLVTYYGPALDEAHLPFNFQLLTHAWDAAVVAELIRRYEAALPEGAWPNWVLGNHDRPRIASRVGPAQARVAAVLLLTLRGTPTIYQGEELGMEDAAIPPAEVRDPAELREPGRALGRDPQRTPMMWDGGPGRGFTTGTPWLRFGGGADVAAQEADAGSMLALYRGLIRLRRGCAALVEGAIHSVAAQGPVLSYVREGGGLRVGVALNFSDVEQEGPGWTGEVLFSASGRAGPMPAVLAGAEAVVVLLA